MSAAEGPAALLDAGPATSTAAPKPTDLAGPYVAQARAYLAHGWAPLPLPPGAKWPPPRGWTGADAPYPSGADVEAWVEQHPAANLAVRLPGGVLGIDVDHYGDKKGGATLDALVAALGPLPRTVVSSRRFASGDFVSGVRLYRVPGGRPRRIPASAGPGIDLIHAGHRYVVAGPSNVDGMTYAAVDERSGELVDVWPRPDALPELPEPWLAHLEAHATPAASEVAAGAYLTDGRPCRAVLKVVDRALATLDAGGGRHDTYAPVVLALIRLGEQGHEGVRRAVDELRASFVASVTADQTRTTPEAVSEYARMLDTAAGKVAAAPTPEHDRGCCGPLASSNLADLIAPTLAAEPSEVDDQPADLDPLGGHLTAGGAFILDEPAEIPCRWGTSPGAALWAEGEELMIVGPPGAGKTTVAGQIVAALLVGGQVLDQPVKPARRVLYLAMDRPRQIARALRRQLGHLDRSQLDGRLSVWKGPPPQDVAQHPGTLLALARAAGADVLVVDSIKDAAVGLASDEVGAGYNRAVQACLAAGVDVLALHHQRKASGDNKKPKALADVYGSTWLTSGAGSVVLIWADAGSDTAELIHLKPVAEPVGPWVLEHDHDAGRTTVAGGAEQVSVERVAQVVGSHPRPLNAAEVAALLGVTDRGGAERVRRRLRQAVTQGLLSVGPKVTPADGGRARDIYTARAGDKPVDEQSREQSRAPRATTTHAGNHGQSRQMQTPRSEAITLPITSNHGAAAREQSRTGPPLEGTGRTLPDPQSTPQGGDS